MYIAVDLKVIEGLASSVARASGSTEDAILAGLARVWHHCWVAGSDRLTMRQLAGLFSGPNPCEALIDFGFLEALQDDPGFRVRGATRYLRLKESRRAGAAATNAARSKSAPKLRSKASASDAQATLNDALPPSTEHRAPNTEIKRMGPGGPHHETIEAFVGLFQSIRGVAYVFSKKADAPAMKAMLAHSPPHEILRRAEIGLRNTRFPKVDTLAQLSSQWNSLAKSADAAVFDPNGGILTRPATALVSKPCTVQGCGAESWDGVTCIEHAPEMLERT